jgi:HNH endonuclease
VEKAAAIGMFERVISPLSSPSIDDLRVAVSEATLLENMLSAIKTRLMNDLNAQSAVGQDVYAKAANVSLGQSDQVVKRARFLRKVAPVADAFEDGELSTGHVEAFASVYRQVKPAVQTALTQQANELVEVGRTTTSGEFRKRVAAAARELEDADDAEERLVRQKRATRLKLWLDPESGMGRLSGWFDPESYRLLHGRIINETEARFHDLTPEHCPDDPIERQQFLRAHALAALTTGDAKSGSSGASEVVIVHHRNDDVDINWSIEGLELPDSALDRILATRARIYDVIVRNGSIVSAPGELNLGRTSRLANRAQRRALAAVHTTCCYPGCEVRYWQTKLHHLIYWRNGGRTDLNNLVPLCAHHHAKVHAENIALRLFADRSVRFTHANSHTQHSTGPPQTRAG